MNYTTTRTQQHYAAHSNSENMNNVASARIPQDKDINNSSDSTTGQQHMYQQQEHHVLPAVPGEWFCWGSLCGTWLSWLQCGSSSGLAHRMHSPAWETACDTWNGHGGQHDPATAWAAVQRHKSQPLYSKCMHLPHKVLPRYDGYNFEKTLNLKWR